MQKLTMEEEEEEFLGAAVNPVNWTAALFPLSSSEEKEESAEEEEILNGRPCKEES